MAETVKVQSTTINNELFVVVFKTVMVLQGGVEQERELSRAYKFIDFQAEMPFKHAQILVKERPEEFRIVEVTNESKEILNAGARVVTEARAAVRMEDRRHNKENTECPFCDKVCKDKRGLSSHIRLKHPKQWKEYKAQ